MALYNNNNNNNSLLKTGFHIVVIVVIQSATIANQVLQKLQLNGNACCNPIGDCCRS